MFDTESERSRILMPSVYWF